MNEKIEQGRLLIIDDEKNMRHMLSALLEKAGYVVDSASDGREGHEKIQRNQYDFILCDLKMPRMDGMQFLAEAGEHIGNTTVIMMSAYGTIKSAVEAMKLGAYDYISKPFKTDEVLLALKKAEERERLKKENLLLRQKIRDIEQDYSFAGMIAKSRSMRDVFRLARKVSQYDTIILVCGESGTGKELIARGIHEMSKRSQGPWVPVNCGGIPENLLESEFFGYKKGAFTGADANRKGLFEEASGGTIFLDEIGELPINLQVKLLRALQESEIRPIGDASARKIDTRVIAATAKKLEREVEEGTFRQDLFYRLNVVQIKLPPLRQRKEDIPLLATHFANRFSKRFDKPPRRISSSAMALLLKHDWPGNVRELKNMMERAVILTEADQIAPENLPKQLLDRHSWDKNTGDFPEGFSIKEAQKIIERKLIVRALEATGGNRTKASQLLEISHPSLLTKIKAYHIDL